MDGEGGESSPPCPPRLLCPSLLAWQRSMRIEKERGFREEGSVELEPVEMISPSPITCLWHNGLLRPHIQLCGPPFSAPRGPARDARTDSPLAA